MVPRRTRLINGMGPCVDIIIMSIFVNWKITPEGPKMGFERVSQYFFWSNCNCKYSVWGIKDMLDACTYMFLIYFNAKYPSPLTARVSTLQCCVCAYFPGLVCKKRKQNREIKSEICGKQWMEWIGTADGLKISLYCFKVKVGKWFFPLFPISSWHQRHNECTHATFQFMRNHFHIDV